jgi:hypothetical protein
MKRVTIILTVMMLLFCTATASAADTIHLIVNGKEITPDVPPQVINGRTMVPARHIAEALGANVNWDESSRSVYINWTDYNLIGIAIADRMQQNQSFKNDILKVYYKYYDDYGNPKTASSQLDQRPAATNNTDNQQNNYLISQLQSQIANIKSQAQSKRTTIETNYTTAKSALDQQVNEQKLAASRDAAGRGLSSSPLSNYEKRKIDEAYAPYYKQLKDARDQDLADVDTWEQSTIAPLEERLKQLQ